MWFLVVLGSTAKTWLIGKSLHYNKTTAEDATIKETDALKSTNLYAINKKQETEPAPDHET